MVFIELFFELFGLCKFGSFNTTNGKKDFADIMTAVFTNGYDFRHGIALAVPLIVTEFTIKVVWAIRRRFVQKMPLNKCIQMLLRMISVVRHIK